jgi:hypothetical protein
MRSVPMVAIPPIPEKTLSVFIRSYPCSSVFQRFTAQKNAFAASSGSAMPVTLAFCSRCQK